MAMAGAESETDSLTDAYEAAEDRIKAYRDNLVLPEGSAGVLVTTGNRIVGRELFDCQGTLARIWPRLSEA